MEEPQLLAHWRTRDQAHPGHVAAWSVQACDKATLDWIVPADEDNRNLCGHRLSHRRRRGIRDDHSHLTTYKIGNHSPEPIVLTRRPMVFNGDIPPFDITHFLQ